MVTTFLNKANPADHPTSQNTTRSVRYTFRRQDNNICKFGETFGILYP
jgi:hypothetical protein